MLLTKLKVLTAVLVLGATVCGGGILAYQTATAHEGMRNRPLTDLAQARARPTSRGGETSHRRGRRSAAGGGDCPHRHVAVSASG